MVYCLDSNEIRANPCEVIYEHHEKSDKVPTGVSLRS